MQLLVYLNVTRLSLKLAFTGKPMPNSDMIPVEPIAWQVTISCKQYGELNDLCDQLGNLWSLLLLISAAVWTIELLPMSPIGCSVGGQMVMSPVLQFL